MFPRRSDAECGRSIPSFILVHRSVPNPNPDHPDLLLCLTVLLTSGAQECNLDGTLPPGIGTEASQLNTLLLVLALPRRLP